ncbi:MAG: septum formation family protein [Nocardioides sp.]
MPRPRLTRTLSVTAAVAAVLLSVPAYAGSQRATGALTGAPSVGTCTTLTPAQAEQDTDSSTVVPCKQPHTALVAGVVKLPKRLDWDTATDQDLRGVVADRCGPKILTTLGPSTWARADTTAYGTVWFRPTSAEMADGARWLSCSVVLEHGAKLADLPKKKAPLVPGGQHADGIARCLTLDSATGTYLTTTCSASHDFRASGTFTYDVAKRPAVKALNKVAARRCLSKVDTTKRFYRFTYRDAATWAAGDHTVVCYSQTHQVATRRQDVSPG